MREAKKGKWLGGYVREGKKGATYVIERWINGIHWHVSTKCRTERAALKELEKFEADPVGYRRARTEKTRTAAMTPELVAAYLEDMERRRLDAGYVRQAETYLGQIMVATDGRDLSRMTFIDLARAIESIGPVDQPAARNARIKAMKAFCKWLRRKEGLLNRANDPSLDLETPSLPPERLKRRKVMDLAVVERAIQALPDDLADVAVVLSRTGMHISELARLHSGKGGLYEPAPWQTADGVLVNIAFVHKRNLLKKDGDMHVVSLREQPAVDALKRILARPHFPTRGRIARQLETHKAKTGDDFHFGWLRHSFTTWAATTGDTDENIANALGHTSTKQVQKTYKDLGFAARPVKLPALKLVKG